MKTKRSHTYGQEYEAVEQVIDGQEKKLSFTCNVVFLAAASVSFFELYWAFGHRRLNYFVTTSLLIDIIYPFLLKLKNRNASLIVLLFQGSLLSSVLYDCWTLAYPHKIFIYYVPLLLGSLGKVYHLIGGDCSKEVGSMVESLSKFQSKIQILVVMYSFIAFLIKFKFNWPRVMKVVLVMLIIRVKYWHHYATQQAWNQIHQSLDNISRTLLVRTYYQEIYSRFMRIGNSMNQRKVIIL